MPRWKWLFSALLVTLLVGSAQAQGPRIVLGTGPDYPPFSDSGMVRPGVATQLVTLVFERLGYSVDLERKPWNRLIREARSLGIMAIYPYVVTPERKQDFLASEPLFEIKLRFFGLASVIDDLEFDDETDPVRLCRPNGFALNEDLRPYLKHHDEVTWIRPNSLESCFLMLERKRVDLVPINLATGLYTILRTFEVPPPIQTLELFEQDATLHLLVPKVLPGAEVLLARFNEELAALKLTPTGQRIIERVDQFLVSPPDPIASQ